MPLTANQIDTVRALDWLLDPEGQRRTGRTFALAIALIRQALRYPGRDIYYMDHVGGLAQRDMMHLCRNTIEAFTHRDPFLRHVGWTFRQRAFRATLPTETLVTSATIPMPPEGWWPDERAMEPTLANLLQDQEGDALVAEPPGSLRAALAQERELDEQLKQIDEAARKSAWERLGADDAFGSE
jgi:hypothetical protein